MRLPRAHSHLRPKPVPKPIREPRTSIDKHASTINTPTERLGVGLILRDDAVRVMRGMVVDVRDGRGERGDAPDREVQVEELRFVVCWSCRDDVCCERGVGGKRREGGEG